MRDTSLDEFLDDGDDAGEAPDRGEVADAADRGEADADGSEAAADSTDPTDAPGPSAVEPAVPTYDWTPEGAACEACDAVVERRWRDDAGLVCADCKTW